MTLLGHRNPLRRLVNAIPGALRRPRPPASRRTTFVVGHRGSPRDAPENTIASFARAIDLGADAVEADVCVTRDGHFVLWHDCHPGRRDALVRQAGGEKYAYEPSVPPVGSSRRRPVDRMDLEEFVANYGYEPSDDDSHRERVPVARLADLFAWANREARVRLLCLDVKLDEKQVADGVELARAVRAARRDGSLSDRLDVAILCPHREILQAVLTEDRREPLGKDIRVFADFEFPGVLEFAKHYGASCVSLGVRRRLWPELRRELAGILAAREAGPIEQVIVWTVNEEKRLRELVARGVDGILTDDVPLLRRIVGEGSSPT